MANFIDKLKNMRDKGYAKEAGKSLEEYRADREAKKKEEELEDLKPKKGLAKGLQRISDIPTNLTSTLLGGDKASDKRSKRLAELEADKYAEEDKNFIDTINKPKKEKDALDEVIAEETKKDNEIRKAENMLREGAKKEDSPEFRGVGTELNKIEDSQKEADSTNQNLEPNNPNNVFGAKYTTTIDPNDSPDVMADKMLVEWEADRERIEKEYLEDRDKLKRDQLITGLLLAAQGIANGMAVKGTGRVPAQVDTSILRQMEDSLNDDRDYKLKRAAQQLSNAKYLIQNANLRKSTLMREKEREENRRLRKQDKAEAKKERDLYQVEKAAQGIEKDFDRQKKKFVKEIQAAGSESDKIAKIKEYFPKMDNDDIQKMVDAGVFSWEKTGAELASALEGRFDEQAKDKINRLYKAKGIERDSFEEPVKNSLGYDPETQVIREINGKKYLFDKATKKNLGEFNG